MKSNDLMQIWRSLTALARRAPADSGVEAAPYGFSTRVVALAFAESERRIASVFEILAPRALWVAALLVAGSIAINYSSFGDTTVADTATLADQDPIAMLFE
jgi:hypothetical protein